jgi:diguanylate cyclase (GGDEF)-like protein
LSEDSRTPGAGDARTGSPTGLSVPAVPYGRLRTWLLRHVERPGDYTLAYRAIGVLMVGKPFVSVLVLVAGGIALHPNTEPMTAAAIGVWAVAVAYGVQLLRTRRTGDVGPLAAGLVIACLVSCLPIALTRDVGGPWQLFLIWPVLVASALAPVRLAWLATGTVLAGYGSIVAAWGRTDRLSQWLTVAVWLAATTLVCSGLHATSRALAGRLREQALHDPLTGLSNRRAFDASLDARIVATGRRPQRITVLVFDLDNFKRVNDTWGHATGDAVLSRFGDLLAGGVRPGDLAARIGGEEFAVVMSGAHLGDGVRRAEEIRRSVEVRSARSWGRTVTVSGGVACRPEGADESGVDLLAAADDALYKAKAAGRNAVRANRRASPRSPVEPAPGMAPPRPMPPPHP